MLSLAIDNAEAMEDLGRRCAQACQDDACQAISSIYLQGDLGAGKTTFVRGFLRGMGHEGAVKSPTYTLVEPYQFKAKAIYHFDLYRLNDAEELEAIGARDYFNQEALCLVEWPEKAQGFLPEADMLFNSKYDAEGRLVTLKASSDQAKACLSMLKNQL